MTIERRIAKLEEKYTMPAKSSGFPPDHVREYLEDYARMERGEPISPWKPSGDARVDAYVEKMRSQYAAVRFAENVAREAEGVPLLPSLGPVDPATERRILMFSGYIEDLKR